MRAIYWLTGLLAFFMSPFADNLTTALVMGAVVLSIGAERPRFVVVACINVVVAANAGGAFCPFGDITTLMVWQRGIVGFWEFFALFVPAAVSWLVPAALMSFTVPPETPPPTLSKIHVKVGGIVIACLFVLTIAATVTMHHYLDLPPFMGMMMGLGLLSGYGFYVRHLELKDWQEIPEPRNPFYKVAHKPFDIFISVKRVEWDTLLFFYGIIMCVGGLGALGYLELASKAVFERFHPVEACVLIGILSAIVDNIPVMFAVLGMNPPLTHGQWLLATLTAGIGGSLLSIGSAAGVALMGQARGTYTFFAHLRWSWAIALGYAAGVAAHAGLNIVP